MKSLVFDDKLVNVFVLLKKYLIRIFLIKLMLHSFRPLK